MPDDSEENIMEITECSSCKHLVNTWCNIESVYRSTAALKVCPEKVDITRNACMFCVFVTQKDRKMICKFWPKYPQPVDRLPACPYVIQEQRELRNATCTKQ